MALAQARRPVCIMAGARPQVVRVHSKIARMNASSLPTASRLLFDELLLQPNLRLRVGEHLVDIGALRIVTRPEHPRLTSKAAAVLIELVRHAGDTAMRDHLLHRVWA